jgi:aspartyl protease family protein
MRNIMIFAGVMGAIGIAMARMADTVPPPKSTETKPAQVTVASATTAAPSGRSATIARGNNGHFQTEARVNGNYLDFMVDTGATVIALKERDAARLGINPSPSQYTAKVSTANGQAKAAPTHLASIDIGGVVVRDVDALVMPDGMLDQNLLGMAFLSRLKRFEYANGKLLLEQ